MSGGPLLSVKDLRVQFPVGGQMVAAVDGLTFEVAAGETLGVVGESGAGKSATASALLGLHPREARVTGSIEFRGQELIGLKDRELRPLRGNRIAMIFQDATSSLNPVLRIGDQIGEAIEAHYDVSRSELKTRVVGLLELVGISSPVDRADQYPHEFSGGMRQRAMIAMAIANDPDVLIADEPTTALDVTIQAQVLEVMERIKERTEAAIVLITHDLGVVAGLADRVLVMYAGREVELGAVEDVFYRSRHPYTRGLLASLPRLDRRSDGGQLHRIDGNPPSLLEIPSGCEFHPRCPYSVVGLCDVTRPGLSLVGEAHWASCHRWRELEPA
jgi:oligopeptide/dipeptide ABC transporter ATP-binding protein